MNKWSSKFDHVTLSRKWGILLDADMRTIERTLNLVFRTVMHPSLSRRLINNDRKMRYGRLLHSLFTNIMYVGTVSKSKSKHAQFFTTFFYQTRAYPMNKNSGFC